MTINELFWASAFGAACGVAGVTALMGILSWAWRRVALWWIARKIRQDLLWSYPSGHGEAPPPPPPPTREEILETVRKMGSTLSGAMAGVRACYEGPARVAGTLTEADQAVCPCCGRSMEAQGLGMPGGDLFDRRGPRSPQDEPPPPGGTQGPNLPPPALAGGV